MKKKIFLEFLPIGVLLLIGLGSIIQVLVTDYTFEYRQYIGLILLLVNLILFFTNRSIYKYFFGLTLLFGTFNLIAFSTYIIVINLFFIPFQIIPFLVLIVYSFIYKQEIIELFFRVTQGGEKENQEYEKRSTERFKKNFSGLTDQQIQNKLDQDLVPAAKQALNEIRNERQKTHYNNI